MCRADSWLGVRCMLIANRGECALRIIRTCKKLGISTIAIITEQDYSSPHANIADKKFTVSSYTNIDDIVRAGKEGGADSVHPGYGFLSENSLFAKACIEENINWIGPSPEVMDKFASKTTAKEIAQICNVPCSPGSPAINDVTIAVEWANKIGYPIILKPSGGGGGIGMQVCRSNEDVITHFTQTSNLADRLFGDGTVFLEKFVEFGRHIEVQVFGDGKGNVITLGERECSIQRRFQKIIEESPAPGLTDELRQKVWTIAKRLCEGINYESAGTVEFIFDDNTSEFYFLEVNTRLQVEHGVTEQVSRLTVGPFDEEQELDIVEWMIRQGNQQTAINLKEVTHRSVGSSIQVRVYAEDPTKSFTPTSGVLQECMLPTHLPGSRFESWVYRGCEITPYYDPMIVKILQWGSTRREARTRLLQCLDETHIRGPPNNLNFLSTFIAGEAFVTGQTFTRTLDNYEYSGPYIEILRAGMNTTIQDYPGRTDRGLWRIGVPPSGPMDHLNFRMSNSLVGNSDDAAALEVTVLGPCMKFHSTSSVAITGAPYLLKLNGVAAPMYTVLHVKKNDVLNVEGLSTGGGSRCYIAVTGGFDVPVYLGSRSTFTKGGFGGYQGRELRAGDVLSLGELSSQNISNRVVPMDLRPQYTNNWVIGVLPGPMANPDFMLDSDIEMLMETSWKVHHNSNRLGIRLSGPTPEWSRPDGGEGGSHPSNIHDCEYAIGTINFTGNMPIIIAHDGPSLGGFVCPITIVKSQLWKIGQVKAGDTIKFKLMTIEDAVTTRVQQNAEIESLKPINKSSILNHTSLIGLSNQTTAAILVDVPRNEKMDHPGMTVRMAGDSYVLLEYGPMILDIRLRVRIHQFEQRLLEENPIGLEETAPGVRSLQIRYNPIKLPLPDLLNIIKSIDINLPKLEDYKLRTKVFKLPMAWNTSGVTSALEKYMKSFRPEAPYLPSNINFIGANNGVTVDDVHSKVYSASYMCLGLGDVYLGACCAVPVDPRHRLVVPKFNPARTYTEEGTVGLGGSYMCIYPMDSPGGYQLVGRTLPIWNTWGKNSPSNIFTPEKPWMFEMFDQIRFFECNEVELNEYREQFRAGTFEPTIEYEIFDVAEYSKMLNNIEGEVNIYKEQQRNAAAVQNQLEVESLLRLGDMLNEEEEDKVNDIVVEVHIGCKIVESPVTAKVWEVRKDSGDAVVKGDVIMVLEAMKMEFNVESHCNGILKTILGEKGSMVNRGDNLAIIECTYLEEAVPAEDTTQGTRRSLQIRALLKAYENNEVTPTQIMKQIYTDLKTTGADTKGNIWITLNEEDAVMKAAASVEEADMASMPLYGIPFVVKDNYDVAGMPTTAACPDYSYISSHSATCIQKLLDAGAILIGKSNLDQFATGLVGTRSPYGCCENSFDPAYISGGSSSGSAVSLARGFCSFSLGTDTAGSGRVPAQFNNVIGLKPSKGRISCTGMVPACKSLDCASIFALSAKDAELVLDVMTGYDTTDPFSNDRYSPSMEMPMLLKGFKFGVPRADQLEFFEDKDSAALFNTACDQLIKLGGAPVEIDFAPFRETADLLYEGPWVAERMSVIEKMYRETPEKVLATTRAVIGKADKFNAVDCFRAMYRLEDLRKVVAPIWDNIDILVTPTAGTIYTIDQVNADPVQKNTDMGYYTNFMNLLDMTAIAIPTGFGENKLPYSITVSAPAPCDKMLLTLADQYQRATGLTLGQTAEQLFV